MVMNVGKINSVHFKGVQINNKNSDNPIAKPQINEIPQSIQDYNIKIPQKYTKVGTDKLSNGNIIHSYKLANGYKVTIVPMKDSPAVVKNYVNVGSINETDDIKGISHFLEHMAFNGTNGSEGYTKLSQGDSFKKVDNMGGWANASTNYAITDYVNSTPQLEEKDLEEQIKIIASMTEDLELNNKMIEKEKGPVCSEINMILDNPQTILMDQTVRSLFNIKSTADELVGGSTNHIKNLTREKVKKYYDTYYTPDNMNLVITGDVNPDKVIELVAKNFHSNKKPTSNTYETPIKPIEKTIRKDFISDKAVETNIMLGFAGGNNNDSRAKILYNIAAEYLNSTEAGFNNALKKYNAKPFIGIDKISTKPNNPKMIYYTLSCADNKTEDVLKTIFEEFSSLPDIKEEDLQIIKERLLQGHKESLEYSEIVNDAIGNAIISGTSDTLTNYEEILDSITTDEVNNFNKKHFDISKTAITVVHPSFKGHKKNAVDMSKVNEKTLPNNYKTVFYKTGNDNISFDITLNYPANKNINSAAISVLDEIYGYGTKNIDEESFDKFRERNNIQLFAYADNLSILLRGFSSKDKFKTTISKAKELLETPRISEEEFAKAVETVKDNLNRSQDSSFSLFADYESKQNPLYTSKQDILNNIDKLTLQDIQELHDYILANSNATVTMNIPENDTDFQNMAEKEIEKFAPAKPYCYKFQNFYKEEDKPVVLTKAKPVSQADILQMYKFPIDNSAKEQAAVQIMNNILTNSSIIGLFNTLREKEHLAYSVHSDFDKTDNSGELSLNILTTTDNKEIGEITPDNVQKSIDGFNRQINELINSNYSDEDLESAKRKLKASILTSEGTENKLLIIKKGLYSPEGIEYSNKLLNEIDNITRDDIDNLSKKIFSTNPIYSIVASKDTLEYNKDYLESLKV